MHQTPRGWTTRLLEQPRSGTRKLMLALGLALIGLGSFALTQALSPWLLPPGALPLTLARVDRDTRLVPALVAFVTPSPPVASGQPSPTPGPTGAAPAALARATTAPARSPSPTSTRPPRPLNPAVEAQLSQMTLGQKVGQMFMGSIFGPTTDASSRTLIHDYGFGGIVYVGANVVDPAQTARLSAGLQREAQQAGQPPLLIAIDHEGGDIVRFKSGVTVFPWNMALGAAASPRLAAEEGTVVAAELKAAGINMVLGPVLDVYANPANSVIGMRSYGGQPRLVADLGAAYIQAAQAGGLITVAKHFPGHGNTATDSHFDLPQVTVSRGELDQVDLYPFRQAIQAGVSAIMAGHLAVPALDPSGRPATLSPKMLTGLLRQELGFDGLIVTDAMTMGAIGKHWGGDEAAVLAVEAGADLLIVPGATDIQFAMYHAVVQAVQSGRLSQDRVDASVRRVLALKLGPAAGAGPATAQEPGLDHAAVAREIARQAVTVARNQAGLAPLALQADDLLLLVTSGELPVGQGGPAGSLLGDALRSRHPQTREVVTLAFNEAARETRAGQAVALARSAAAVVVVTWDAGPWQASLVQRLKAVNPHVIVVAANKPGDLASVPDAPAYLATYGARPEQLDALAAVLLGQVTPTGHLPVTIPGLTPEVLAGP